MQQRWSPEQIHAWYAECPLITGSNYAPAYAVNQLQMWQADTFDPDAIHRELAWAASLGMISMRVFLHDLLWEQDRQGFLNRIDQFLGIAHQHGIRTMIVFFDSVWHPFPRLGRQPEPEPGVHNSGWVQSPGATTLTEPGQYPRLEAYVKGVVNHFADDERVLVWDLWNEPGNYNVGSYRLREATGKHEWELALLPQLFAWARSANPVQPLTSGIWEGDWSSNSAMTVMSRIQVALSDIVSFHHYLDPKDFAARVNQLKRFGRPLLCTEFLARGFGSTYASVLPVARAEKIGLYNWGLVAGKTQTQYPWSTWRRPGPSEPEIWHHDLLRPDGTPYDEDEATLLRRTRAEDGIKMKDVFVLEHQGYWREN